MAVAAIAPVELSPLPAVHTKTRVISDFNEFLVLENDWSDLVRRAGVTHPFLEHCWIRTWWECFGQGSRLHIVVVTQGQRLVAVAPLIITKVRMYGVPARRLGFFYNSHVPRAGFIVDPQASDAYEALWAAIQGSNNWDFIHLCQLTEGSDTLIQMQGLANRAALPQGLWKSGASPLIQLDRSWDEHHQALPAKHRSNLRNRSKRFDQLGPVELETVSGEARRAECLKEGLRLEAAAWKGAAGTAILADPCVTRFYELFSERAAERGWLRLNILRSVGRAAAFDYSLEYKDRVFLLKLGYDPEFSPYSPSNLLLGRVLRQSFERGLLEYDFLGEEAEWKRCWTADTQSNYWLYIFDSGWKGRLLFWLKFRLVPKLNANPWFQKALVRISGSSNL